MLKNIIIIGGGIAGLIAAIRLSRESYKVLIIEKNNYPRHKVCGEYLSREAECFLNRENLIPNNFKLPQINNLQITSAAGKSASLTLPLGGIGISRYLWENYLYELALKENVQFTFDSVAKITFNKVFYAETLKGQEYPADIIIGAYGKRSNIDKELKRKFFTKRSPYLGIKFHAKNPEHPESLISLHNFNGGYCGISHVENNVVNYCYLCERKLLRKAGNIENLEKNILSSNPVLTHSFNTAVRLFDKPLVINEISFDIKSPVENSIPMIGDAAGMITPLCGNGMAMAAHSAKIISDIIINNPHFNLNQINQTYAADWTSIFKNRLIWGKYIQNFLFGKDWASSVAVGLGNNLPKLSRYLITKTYGKNI